MEKEIENKIKKLEEAIKRRDELKRLRDSDYPKNDHRFERHIELLKTGVKVEEIKDGFLVNNKFIVAAQKNRWRVDEKWTWYRFKNIPDFVERYVKK